MAGVTKAPVVPEPGSVVVYATGWCAFCRRLLAALPALDVPFTVVDVEADDAAARFVESVNGGNRVVPTVVFADGTTLTNPEPTQVQAKAVA